MCDHILYSWCSIVTINFCKYAYIYSVLYTVTASTGYALNYKTKDRPILLVDLHHMCYYQ